MTTLLSASQLTRYYHRYLAVNNFEINLQKGEVLGFLGPNGAGKSTTMKMLSGNLAPDRGEIHINGYNLLTHPKQAKRHLGYLPENPPLLRELTVTEFLTYCAGLHEIPTKQHKTTVQQVIERCGLEHATRKLIGQLSKGNQQRIGIAQAIIHAPAVVILDEPTSGLDPMQIHEIRSLIRHIANEHSVILSTHILPEVESLCDRVQIISHGHLVFSDTLPKLNAQRGQTALLVEFEQPPALETLQQLPGISQVEALSRQQFRLHHGATANPTESLLKAAVEHRWGLKQLTPETASLESLFLQIIQNEPRVMPT